ncbi:organic solute transporter Ostalpha-domain-containing protein, partial [Ilyonectria robusta]|uniref:organic solute transporter Ostalpha-domain-containing protein n=1 Tax=Ilyonectria robusta TaxID=1079257 RepID=UPI001E8EE03D
RWLMIFQYPVVSLTAAIATEIIEVAGIYCEYVTKPYFAKLWISVIRNILLVLAVLSVLKFYKALKTHTKEHKPLAKLFAFKLVVGLGFLQRIIFWILSDINALDPTDTLTFADINIGISNLLTCLEMVPLSIFFLYAYSWNPYLIHNLPSLAQGQQSRYHGGIIGVRAYVDMINTREIVDAI